MSVTLLHRRLGRDPDEPNILRSGTARNQVQASFDKRSGSQKKDDFRRSRSLHKPPITLIA